MIQPAASPFLIVGLGNHGRGYRANRHNVGFMLVDALARRHSVTFSKQQSKALITDFRLDTRRIFMIKPQTFMNRSGQAVASIVRYYHVPIENLIVVYDDLDLPLGMIRIRPSGGTAGHRGMESIRDRLGTIEFPRLRIGIDRPPGQMDPAAYVLQDFRSEELELLELTLDRATDCIQRIILTGIDDAMNNCNVTEEPE